MAKRFNVTGACKPARHYMVNLTSRLEEIKSMVDGGDYFAINRARQYGKTTVLQALADYLKNDYLVISLDFQRLSYSDFEKESAFVHGLAREVGRRVRFIKDTPEEVREELEKFADKSNKNVRLAEIFDCFSMWCGQSEKPVVLIIDEVDTATDNQVFVDFLAQLRTAYLDNDMTPTFQSVILAGVYDVRSVKRKIRPDGEHRENSPWNIAAKFGVEMEFSVTEIAEMLREYEKDHQTGMDVDQISGLLYDYTSGYPYLVSRLCKCMDEDITNIDGFQNKGSAWTKAGFVKVCDSSVEIANRIFEERLYNRYLLDYREQKDEIYIESSGIDCRRFSLNSPMKNSENSV